MTESTTADPRPSEPGAAAEDTTIRRFRVEVPEEELDELRRRIQATRWPSKELVADRSQGVQLATLQALARSWATEDDWRRCEARLIELLETVGPLSDPTGHGAAAAVDRPVAAAGG